MIKNLWSKIRLICGNHELDRNSLQDAIYMQIHSASTSDANMFYSCPKYYPDAREAGEAACRNHISVVEFENCLKHISDILESDMALGSTIDLTGHKWTSKGGVKYQVLKHNAKHIDILCLNERSLWK